MLDVSLENLIAFGDGENGGSWPWLASVCHGNAMPQVRSCRLGDQSNDDDGIYHALRELGLQLNNWQENRYKESKRPFVVGRA